MDCRRHFFSGISPLRPLCLGKEGLKDFLLQLSLGAATVIGIIFIIFLIAYLIKDIKRQKFTNVQMNEDNFCDKNVSLPQILLV